MAFGTKYYVFSNLPAQPLVLGSTVPLTYRVGPVIFFPGIVKVLFAIYSI